MKYRGDIYDTDHIDIENPNSNEFNFHFERTKTFGKNNLEYNYNIKFEDDLLKIKAHEDKKLISLIPILKKDIFYDDIVEISYDKSPMLTFNDILITIISSIAGVWFGILSFSDIGIKAFSFPLVIICFYIFMIICKTSKIIRIEVFDENYSNNKTIEYCLPFTTGIFIEKPKYVECFYEKLKYKILDTELKSNE